MNPGTELLAAVARLEVSRDLLAKLVKDSADAETAGKRTLLWAYVFDPGLVGTQRQLARRLGLSESRVSRMCKSLRRSMGANPGNHCQRVD